ncbi:MULTISPECIES: hypothetical protein [unclassified Microcoleus]|uniref:hypothetical protein n=1 Tax=unclassified Microcoleus TaxID=2642155 RepID=UPI00312B7694
MNILTLFVTPSESKNNLFIVISDCYQMSDRLQIYYGELLDSGVGKQVSQNILEITNKIHLY